MTNKNQKTGIKDQEGDPMERLLRDAMRPVVDQPELNRDLWPAMLRRMDEQASRGAASVPWFDWALGGALLAFAAMAPRTIPVILYYL
ncbi:MAG TPA: hypothetical protein VL135_01620 [Terracidiphilus sp.]|jgi:hypothetical protein|nr:hypothetical protein [Terracidiphilus sp.]